MRPTFFIDLDCRLQSANAPKERPHVFKPGDQLWLAEDAPYDKGVIPALTRFFVSRIDDEDGTMWLLAEGDVPALFYADNMLVLMPWGTEDILPYLRVAVRVAEYQEKPEDAAQRLPRSNVRQLGKLALVAAMAAVFWSLPTLSTKQHDLFTNLGTKHAIWNNTSGNELTIRT